MKKFIILIAVLIYCQIISAQKNSGIELMPVLQTNDEAVAKYGKQFLLSKLGAEIAATGNRGVDIARFIVVMKMEPIEKQNNGQLLIVKYNIECSVEDLLMKKSYSHFMLEIGGIGKSEGQCVMDAAKRMDLQKQNFAANIKSAVDDIISYYNANCSSILQKTKAYADAGDFEEAFANLYQLPESNNISCRNQYNSMLASLLKQQVSQRCQSTVTEAAKEWSTSPDANGASSVAAILSGLTVTPDCAAEYKKLLDEIKRKRLGDEVDEKKLQIKVFDSQVMLEKDKIAALSNVASAYYKSQMPQVYLY